MGKKKNVDISIPWESTHRGLCQSHKTLPPKTQISFVIGQPRHSMPLSSPYGSHQCTCALTDKHHHPPAFDSRVVPPRHFHLIKLNFCCILGSVLGIKNADHTAQSNQNTTYEGRDGPMAASWAFRNPSAPRLVGGALMSALPTMSWSTL